MRFALSDGRAGATKLLRSVRNAHHVGQRLYSYQMVLPPCNVNYPPAGSVPANVKFEVVKVLDDGVLPPVGLPQQQIKIKGSGKITVRNGEYTIKQEGQQQNRLITDLTDISLFPALC